MAALSTSTGEEAGDTDLKSLLKRYQECATSLMQSCQKISQVPGAVKLERKCAAELKYLRSLSARRGGFNKTHLRSSNLGHYAGIIHSVDNMPDVTHVLQAFSCPGRSDALHIDVVAYHGHAWVKVIARKAQAVHLTWAGQGQFGERDITLIADDYLVCSKQHTVNFQVPKVVFAFYNGVTNEIADELRSKGIVVIGELIPVDPHTVRQLSNFELQSSESDDSGASIECDPISSTGLDDRGFATLGENSYDSQPLSNLEEQLPTDICSFSKTMTDATPMLEFTTCDCRICKEWKGRPHSFTNLPIKVDSNSDKGSINFMANETVLSEQLSSLSWPLNERSVSCSIDYQDGKCSRLSSSVNDDPSIFSSDNNCLQKVSENISCEIAARNNHDSQSNQRNLVTVGDLDCKSVDSISSEKHLQFESDLRDKSNSGLDGRQDKWNFGSVNVLHFIHNELLLHSMLDYSILRKLRAANEINTIYNIHRVNLDVTTLISLVSAVSHGGCHYLFREKILSEQAAEERRAPVLPKLLAFLEGKSLYACQTAVDSFNSIIGLLGGKNETSRANELLSLVTVIPDNSSFRASTLPNSGKLKDRSKVIFGTGDSLVAVTTTANSGFIRAAERQGVTFSAFIHDARALTEMKETTAQPIT